MKKKKRLTRLLEIILLVQSRPDWRPAKLAQHFGISETRLYQDIRELASAGVPISFSGIGYKIHGDFKLGCVELSPNEMMELLYPGFLFSDSHDSAEATFQAKLAACLPSSLSGAAGSAKTRIRVRSVTVRGPLFERLHRAVSERRRVIISYMSRAAGRRTEREVDPYALIFRKHSWYLIGKCHLRGEVRKFRIGRILAVACTQVRFPESADFSLEEFTRGWWDIYGGESANIAIRFSRRVADLIREQSPRPGQTIQEMPGGEIIYRVNVRGIDEIGWWVMQYGPEAEVLEPAALRKRIHENSVKMVRLYSRSELKQATLAAEQAANYSS